MRKKVTTSLSEPVGAGFVEKACKLTWTAGESVSEGANSAEVDEALFCLWPFPIDSCALGIQ